ncbi:MAG: Poly(3-hydroxyalkanoate) depolymerase, partial [uncultured Gemmatimonadetes bacterium]
GGTRDRSRGRGAAALPPVRAREPGGGAAAGALLPARLRRGGADGHPARADDARPPAPRQPADGFHRRRAAASARGRPVAPVRGRGARHRRGRARAPRRRRAAKLPHGLQLRRQRRLRPRAGAAGAVGRPVGRGPHARPPARPGTPGVALLRRGRAPPGRRLHARAGPPRRRRPRGAGRGRGPRGLRHPRLPRRAHLLMAPLERRRGSTGI